MKVLNKYLVQGVIIRKIQKKDLNKIEASFVEGNQKMKNLKIKVQRC